MSLAGTVLLRPLVVPAQAPTRLARIGYLDLLEPHDLYEVFRQGLRERGYHYCVTNF